MTEIETTEIEVCEKEETTYPLKIIYCPGPKILQKTQIYNLQMIVYF